MTTDEAFIRRITGIILDNLGDSKFGATELVRNSGMSRYKLNKKLESSTGVGINQYIRNIRLRKAFEMLQDDSFTISEVAYKTGFSSPAYFNKCFHDLYGHPPGKAKGLSSENQKESFNPGRIKELLLSLKYYIAGILIALLFGIILLINKGILKWKTGSVEKSSVAVMPFQNLTNDPEMDIWQYALQRNLITELTGTGELEVIMEKSIITHIQREGVTKSSISYSIANSISKKLNADYFISGSYQRAGGQVRINASMCDTRRNVVLRSFEVNGSFENFEVMFDLSDTLRDKVTTFMLISKMIDKNPYYQHSFTAPRSVNALRYYRDATKSDVPAEKIRLLKKSLASDSTFYQAALSLEFAYGTNGDSDSSRMWLIKNYLNRDRMSDYDRLYASWAYAFTFGSYDEQINYLADLVEMDSEEPGNQFLLGLMYCLSEQYEKAIPALESSLNIYTRWGNDFLNDARNYRNFKWLGIAYNNTNQLRKQKRLYKTAEKYIDHPWMDLMKSSLAFSLKDTTGAYGYIEKARNGYKKFFNSEAFIYALIGDFFKHANKPPIADKHYRKALAFEPDNIEIINKFADFCYIDNLHYDLAMMEKAMKLCNNKQQYYEFLSEKGMCLAVQGKYGEAFNAVQKAWEEAPFKVYKLKYYLEEVKKSFSQIE